MISIILTVHNKEFLIDRVVKSIVDNTTSQGAELIVVFDGCSDNSEKIVNGIDKGNLIYKRVYMPDVFETMSNNAGMKMATGDYFILVQDDMVIEEKGWDERLLKPFIFDDVFAVSARAGHNFSRRDSQLEHITSFVDKRTANRDTFYIRNSVNRGPLAFRKSMIVELGYLDEIYAPYTWDEHDVCYRAYEKHGWKSGLYLIDYISEPNWGSTRNKSVGVFYWAYKKNADIFYERHKEYLEENHNEERKI